jgi:pimeloyl-ACP methyl ester carboxylesterase/DNA-binding CsgD family transcriptional regulator
MALEQDIRFARLASGARLAWAASGRGPPLLRAAHWMTHVAHDVRSPIWQPWLQRLGRELRVVRYDERGCGMSEADSTPLSLASAVEELAVVADAAGLQRFALLGISGGAAPAIAYAVRHPERVSHLVLLGGYACGTLAGTPSDDQRAYCEATLRLVRLGWGKAGSPVQQFFTATMIPAGTPAQVAALNEQQSLCCGAERAEALMRARLELDVQALLPELRCPTLVLHVTDDATVHCSQGLALAGAIAGARFVALDGRNHIPLEGDLAFEQLCEALSAFLRAPAATGGADGSANAGGGASPHTARERELLRLVAQGRDNAQIAAHLGLAEKTVRNAMSQLYRRRGVEGRPQAVVRARELGYG